VYCHRTLIPSTLRAELSRTQPQGYGTTHRLCAVHCCFQLLCGQPGLATKIASSTWPILRCGYSIAMLLGFDRTTGYFHGMNACATALLDRLYTMLARRNKCIQGRSTGHQEDQDARELFLALLISLDREGSPSEPLDTCRLQVLTRMTCANSICSNQLERTDPDRVVKLLVPPDRHDQPPLHLEAILQGYSEPRAVEHKCVKCGANFHIHQTSIREASQDELWVLRSTLTLKTTDTTLVSVDGNIGHRGALVPLPLASPDTITEGTPSATFTHRRYHGRGKPRQV
jgi:hypothetical protein